VDRGDRGRQIATRRRCPAPRIEKDPLGQLPGVAMSYTFTMEGRCHLDDDRACAVPCSSWPFLRGGATLYSIRELRTEMTRRHDPHV
jgi:hypothetical protein